jgi:uncharacterized protein (TIGR03435 family)
MKQIALFALAVLAAWQAGLQPDSRMSAQSATFDAASVKPNMSGDTRMRAGTTGRTYTATNMPLRRIILAAYELQPLDFRLVGGPAWIGSDRFDIVATIPDGSSPRQVPAMLRSLLAERFKLIVHTETREAPMYALVLARSDGRLGPQLIRAAVDCDAEAAAGRVVSQPKPGEPLICESEVGSGILGRGKPLSWLARMLPSFVERPVVDRTGLTGGFNFDLQVAPQNSATGPEPGGGIFTALNEQLGLKLESIRGPLEFVVIDSVDAPTAN